MRCYRIALQNRQGTAPDTVYMCLPPRGSVAIKPFCPGTCHDGQCAVYDFTSRIQLPACLAGDQAGVYEPVDPPDREAQFDKVHILQTMLLIWLGKCFDPMNLSARWRNPSDASIDLLREWWENIWSVRDSGAAPD